MAKKKDKRSTRPQRRPARAVPAPAADEQDRVLDTEALEVLREAWRSSDPYDLLLVACGVLAFGDPRLYAVHEDQAEHPTFSDLVDGLIATSYAETTAILHILRVLVDDEPLAARIDAELAQRRQPMPTWITGMRQARILPDVWVVTDAVGSGADYLFGATLPGGRAVTGSMYVDDNLEGIAKNGFVTTREMEALVDGLPEDDDPDLVVTKIDLATARAAMERAIDLGARLHPLAVSRDWPGCRPLIEWLLRLMPAGGVVPEPQVWSPQQIAALADDFFTSRFGLGIDDDDHRSLLSSVLSFAAGQGNRDPLRWGGSRVEILLLDWFPQEVRGTPSLFEKLPKLLAAYIRFAHARAGIGRNPTSDALAALDHFAPAFTELLRDTGPERSAPSSRQTRQRAGKVPADPAAAYASDLFGA